MGAARRRIRGQPHPDTSRGLDQIRAFNPLIQDDKKVIKSNHKKRSILSMANQSEGDGVIIPLLIFESDQLHQSDSFVGP